jgi:expansin (peptidoglycan-binding protein)
MNAIYLFALICALVVSCRNDDDSHSNGNDTEVDGDGDAAPIDGPFSGDGTYYGATGDGACMLGPSPNDMDVAALNNPQWAGSAWCGACAEVCGPNGNVRVRIVDLCPECSLGDLDFSEQAFGKIAEMAAGRVPITWNFVPCDVSGNVSYKYKDGVNPWWTAVQVRNHRRPIDTLEWSSDGTSWNPTTRAEYNFFLDEQGFGPDGVRVRITAADGQILEDDLPPVQAELEVEGASQFQ